jgi:transglutaminase/protease-like cytokinesis protein 3
MDDFYFLCEEDKFIYSHYPEEEKWKLSGGEKEINSLEVFWNRPLVRSSYFRNNLIMVSHS